MPQAKIGWTARIRKRLKAKDAHYSGSLVAGAKVLEIFGDAATALCMREAGVEGLFRAYQEVEFLKPVFAGDTLEITARIIRVGNTSRTMKFQARKIHPREGLVTHAIGTVVVASHPGKK